MTRSEAATLICFGVFLSATGLCGYLWLNVDNASLTAFIMALGLPAGLLAVVGASIASSGTPNN